MWCCIYCKISQRTEMFNQREHVLPQSFGKFENNLILNRKKEDFKQVCNDCNSEFSKLETCLGKDSFEGVILRTKFLKEVEGSFWDRIRITVNEGEYKGLYVSLINGTKIDILPQVALKNKNGNWDYFLLNEINKIYKENYCLEKASIRTFQLSNEDSKKYLKQAGIKLSIGGELNNLFSKDDVVL